MRVGFVWLPVLCSLSLACASAVSPLDSLGGEQGSPSPDPVTGNDSATHPHPLPSLDADPSNSGTDLEVVDRTPEPPPPPVPWELPPLQQRVETYELEMPAATLQAFYDNVWLSEQPATFIHAGQRYPVEVRLRGRSSRFFPKKSWKVDFPSGVAFDGRKTLNLVGMYQDSTMMAEKLALDLLAAMGAPAPRAKYVRLLVNGRYEGVFLEVEEVDKRFLRGRAFTDTDANIYRCGTHDCELKLFVQPYQSDWEKKTNESEPRDDLDAFLRFVNRSPEPAFARELQKRMNVDAYLLSMTADALMSNMTVEDSGSYLVRDRFENRWTYVPWDLNNANSRFWPTYGLEASPLVTHPLFIFSAEDTWILKVHARRSADPAFVDYLPAFSSLTTRISGNAELRGKALDRLERALDELFVTELMHPRIEAIHALLDPHMAQDPYIRYDQFTVGRRYMKDYVTGRISFLRGELTRLRADKRAIVISAFDPNEGWIELENRASSSRDTSALSLRTNLRRMAPQNLPSRSLAPGEKVRFTASDLGVQFGAEGEVGLFVAGQVLSPVDLLFYGALPAGTFYARASGSTAWETRAR